MEKMQRQGDEYVRALETERMKMLVFQRELPLSIELVSRAIESHRQQLLLSSSSSEETTSDCGPGLEFIPLKKPTYASSSGSEEHPQDLNLACVEDGSGGMCQSGEKSWQKSDWLRSVQLWNQSPDPPPNSEELSGEGLVAKKARRSDNGEETKSVEEIHGQTNGSSTSETKESEKNGGSKKEDGEGSLSRRKQRRCWSQDLHRRFLHSLQQLGGADVATPKQIRELMKVDGLTNDEVKSHLQKYRLHTRRPAPPPSQASGSEAQAPKFVIVGGVWAPPSDYTTMALPVPANSEGDRASGAPRSGMYTPIMAAPPLAQPHHPCQQFEFNQQPQVKSKNSESRGDGLARCISLSMSSATRSGPSPVY